MAATGEQLLALASRHVGEKYVFGALAPKNNQNWKGPWDCAEFASWLVFQTSNSLYGCGNNEGNPSSHHLRKIERTGICCRFRFFGLSPL